MRKAILSLLLLGAVATSGCYKIDYTFGPSSGAPTAEEWHHIVILGLVELSDPVALNQICPQGVGVVHQEVSFVNGLVTYIIGNLYTPRTVTVYCASGGAYRVETNQDGMATTVQRLE